MLCPGASYEAPTMSNSDGGGDQRGAAPRRGLAKGLSALLADVDSDAWKRPGGAAPQTVPVEFLRPGAAQPRRRFDKADLDALAESIRAKGVLQPLIVREDSQNPGAYEIIAGERRWRAAQVAKLHEVPVVVRAMSDREALEVGLVENVQRQDLTPLEEAAGYRRLVDEFDHSQDGLARIIGKSRSHGGQYPAAPGTARRGQIDDRRGQAERRPWAAPCSAPTTQWRSPPWSWPRDSMYAKPKAWCAVPGAVRRPRKSQSTPPASAADANTRAIERSLGDLLGLTVMIDHKESGGTMTIYYACLAELDDLLKRLGQS